MLLMSLVTRTSPYNGSGRTSLWDMALRIVSLLNDHAGIRLISQVFNTIMDCLLGHGLYLHGVLSRLTYDLLSSLPWPPGFVYFEQIADGYAGGVSVPRTMVTAREDPYPASLSKRPSVRL